MKHGCFELRKWKSNKTSILNQITNDFDTNNTVHFSESSKTLGLLWDGDTNVLQYRVSINHNNQSIATKRQILSTISQIFEPLGLLSPLIIRAKIFMQRLWLDKLEWDQPIDPKSADFWSNFYNDLRQINSFTATDSFPYNTEYLLCAKRKVAPSAYGDSTTT